MSYGNSRKRVVKMYIQGCTKKEKLEQFDRDFFVVLHPKETFLHRLEVAQRGPLKLKFRYEFRSGAREMDNTQTSN